MSSFRSGIGFMVLLLPATALGQTLPSGLKDYLVAYERGRLDQEKVPVNRTDMAKCSDFFSLKDVKIEDWREQGGNLIVIATRTLNYINANNVNPAYRLLACMGGVPLGGNALNNVDYIASVQYVLSKWASGWKVEQSSSK